MSFSLPVKSAGVRTCNKLALSVDWATEWTGANQLVTFDRRQRGGVYPCAVMAGRKNH